MLKNAGALALAATFGGATALGTQQLLSGTAVVTYRAHQVDIRQASADEPPTAFAYTTKLTPVADGGVLRTDLSGHPCPLSTPAVVDCAKVLLAHGATEACR